MFRLQIRGSIWNQKPSEGWSANIGYNDENRLIPVVTNEPKKRSPEKLREKPYHGQVLLGLDSIC